MIEFRAERWRDLSLIALNSAQTLVIACDSLGGIGPKEADIVKVSGYVVGRFTARVPLMEILSVRATPVALVDTLSVELEPTGRDIRRGITAELSSAGLDPGLVVNGSSEKNVPTIQTGVGITVLGLGDLGGLLIGRARRGDAIACFGQPKVGQEISLDDPAICHPGTVTDLTANPSIREVVPVGSRGIRAEAEALARCYNLQVQWLPVPDPDRALDLEKSAGPSTVVLAIGDREALEQLGGAVSGGAVQDLPFQLLGVLS